MSKNLCDLFAQAVIRYPDNIAVDHEQGCLTYRELEYSSTLLARTLVDLGASKTSPIILVTAHGTLNIVAILAILKAGSCFVPVDRTSSSTERITQVFETVQSSLVINTTLKPFTPPYESCQVLQFSSIPHDGPLEWQLSRPFIKIDSEDLACIMFTSGSTGRPKGVMISHGSLCLYSRTSPVNMDIGPGDRLLHILSVAFDACACVLFSTLCNGGTVVPAEPAELYHRIPSCTVIATTPSLLNNLPLPGSEDTMFANIHTVLLGGETANPDLLGSWVDAGIRVFTAYGLSETTSMGTIHTVERDPRTGGINPFLVGPFMDESPIYLVDEDSTQVVDDGVVGEIVIGGGGVAKGYYKDELKTRKSFVYWKGLRVYKTGDHGRWVRGPSGNRILEFVGRRDRFTKSRGFSVNLDRDVEEKLYLTGRPLGVKSVHAVATEAGIIAVVTPSNVDTALLLKQAEGTMCSYCVPYRIEAIEDFPLSSSGKAQSQTILDIISSIDNKNAGETTTSQAETETSEILKTRATTDERKLVDILCAAGEVLGYSGGKSREIKGDDTFIGVGGSSLLAIRLVSALRKIKINLSVKDLFMCRTFSEIAKSASTTIPPDATARWIAEDPLTAQNLADLRAKACSRLGYINDKFDIGPLTSLQLELAMPTLSNDAISVNQAKLSYNCEYIKMAERAWTAVWRAEPVFRTEISLAIGSGAQIIHKEAIRTPTIKSYDNREEYEAAVKHASMSVGLGCRLDFIYYRQRSVQNGNRSGIDFPGDKIELTVVLTIHHSLMDGCSLEFLLENVERASKGRPLARGNSSIDANLGLIAIQRMQDRQARLFFENYLKDVPLENKAVERLRLAMREKQSGTVRQPTNAWFAPSVSINTVTDFARRSCVSAACVYYCAWAMAISAFERCDNIVIGAVFSNRTALPGHERTIGPYMATLPLLVSLKTDEAVKDLLQRIMKDIVMLREFSWVRSDQIGIGHRLGNILALQLPLPDEKSSPPPFQVETLENSDFPLTMLIEANGQLRMLYDNRQFDGAAVQRISEHFKHSLYSLTKETHIGDCMKINNLHETLLAQAYFATTAPREETIKSALERTVDRFHGHAALEDCSGTTLTYGEVDQMSNVIAHHINNNLSVGKVVAVFGDGTIRWVVSIAGILKTGRAYVPLDPKWSIDRRATVFDESGATALLLPSKTQESEAPATPGLKIFFADSILDANYGANNITRLPDTISADDNLVVVYTSGSTGKPKGIPLTNRGILALLQSCPEPTMFAGPGRRIAQFMSPAFDYCNIELFSTLLHGATLVLRDPRDPFAHLRKVNTATITPSVLSVLNPDDYPKLELIYSTGEPITKALVRKYSTRSLMFNAYGPAECSVVTSYTRVIPGDPITVGVPVPSARMYILDENQQPVPDGAKGEIYLAGIQVMRGYLHAAELTARSVLMDPWHKGERMYRTGDFGSRGHDGRITYLGRIDRQVKLRGFRVELPTVEEAIMLAGEEENITHCAAAAINGTLVAFISCNPSQPILDSKEMNTRLRNRLGKILFSASIPQEIVQVEKFPMNHNGKVDVRALEHIYTTRISDRAALLPSAKSDPIECSVAEEWRQILQLGPDAHLEPADNFFKLGGHSVLVLLLANRLTTAFEVEVTLRELLEVPSFLGQVELLKHLLQAKRTGSGYTEDIGCQDRGGLPAAELTELERQVWLQYRAATTVTAFNIAKVLHIKGFFDVDRLIGCFNTALASDPVFRTNIHDGPLGPVRALNASAPTACWVAELNIDEEVNRHFNVECDQLIRIFLSPEDRHAPPEQLPGIRIVIVTSHIIADLGSIQNLLHLTSQAYSGAKTAVYETPRHLESNRWRRNTSPHEQKWWMAYLKGHGHSDHKLPLLRDSRIGLASGVYNGSSKIRQYNGILVTNLKGRIRETGITQHQLALAAAALMLQWLSGENDIILGAPDSGRRSTVEIEALGQFLDRLPIRVRLPKATTGVELDTNTILTQVRDSAHMALANAIPFSRILDALGFPGEATTSSLFECMVTFHTRGARLDNWVRLHGCTVSESLVFARGSKFPLMLEWFESDGNQWTVHIEYDTDRLLPATIDAIENALDIILDAIANNSTLSGLKVQLGNANIIG
ncbi:non-ribosomal peptide synthetase [Westerdykella ornata]|uniref:Non-ribosomal peptide synthetase n=1 Tax=Westerdykella ornata TaxID=318751 RepID=A0A6A6JVF2_WESOR|nr:non-ribosomal peptide synthetase [Westerdykella ornata]KAF2280367.1 non-ribosomal peptide synthetase [Westerdykella ornata]